MKKVLSNLIKLFLGLLVLSTITSCDNFLEGSDVIKKIEEEIALANALTAEIIVDTDLGQGTTIPTGSIEKKVGYPFTISFTQAPGYQFKCWEVINAKTGEAITDTVTIKNPESIETEVVINSKVDNIKIHAACYERAGIQTVAPNYTDAGVPRDSSITITFSKDISTNNDFSKIQIISGGEDVSSCFKTPVLNGNILTIAADTQNLIETKGLKTVTVSIPADFYYEENGQKINIGSEYKWSYKINETTDRKAEVTVSVPSEKGTTTPNGTKAYSIGEEIELNFTPKDGYNFYYWYVLDGNGNEVPDSVISIENKTSMKTKAKILSAEKGVTISPKSMLLLNISDWSPKMSDSGVPKDSSITIVLNHKISDKNDLSRIKISCNGNDISSNYATPVINENILSIVANKNNLIDVDADKTKTITVSIPSDFYYVEDNENVMMGNSTSFTFKVNETTSTKSEITVGVASEKGTTTPNGTKSYNIGEEFDLNFTPKDGYNFYYWYVLDGNGNEVPDSIISIRDKTALNTKAKVHSAAKGVTISPKSMLLLNISDWSPKMSDSGVPKDSSITITFNKEIAAKNDLSKIQITSNGVDISENYKTPTVNGSILTIAANKNNLIELDPSKTKTITVTLPSDFYYVENNENIKMGNSTSFSFKVNGTTNDKAEVTIGTTSGTLTPLPGTYSYNIGDEIKLKFEPNKDSNFSGWKILDSDLKPVSSSILQLEENGFQATIKVLSKINGVSITPITNKVPKIEDYTPKYNSNGVSYITPIEIKFNSAMKAEDFNGTFNNISITNYSTNLTSYFNLPVLSADGKTLTIKPKFDNPLTWLFSSDSKFNITVKLNNNVKDINNVTIEGDTEWIYRINDILDGYDPIFEALNIAGTEADLANEDKLWNIYTDNRIKDKLWIYLEVSDGETDIDQITVSDKLIKNSLGNSITPEEGNSVVFYNEDLTPIGTENHKYIKFDYDISTEYTLDGLVEITLTIEDYDGHSATRTFNVIKDTTADGFTCYIESYYPNSSLANAHGIGYGFVDQTKGVDGAKFTKDDLINSNNRIIIHPGKEDYYGTYNYDEGKELPWKLYYSQTKNVWSETDCMNISFGDAENGYSDSKVVELPASAFADKTKETFLRLSVTDKMGNIGNCYFNIPGLPETVYSNVYNDSADSENKINCSVSYDSEYLSDSNKAFYAFIIYYKNLDATDDIYTAYSFISNKEAKSGTYYLSNTAPLRDTEYYIQSAYKYNNSQNGLVTVFGPISEMKIAKKTETPVTPLTISNSDVSITKNQKDTQHVKITIPSATASQYENIYLKKISGKNSTGVGYLVPYNSSTETIEFDVLTEYFYNSEGRADQTFYIDYNTGNTVECKYPKENPIEDNVAPVPKNTEMNFETLLKTKHYSGNYIVIPLPSDIGDGYPDDIELTGYYKEWDNLWDMKLPDEAYVKANFSKKEYTSPKNYKDLIVPFGHLKQGTYAVYVEVKDAAGNIGFGYIGKYTRLVNQLSSSGIKITPRDTDITLQSTPYGTNYKFAFEAYYNNKWNTHFTSGETPGDTYGFTYYSYTSKTPLSITNNEKNTFLKIFFTYNERSHMAPFYIYSGREKNSNGAFKICSKNPSAQTGHDPVKVSDILDCTSNIQAYFDEPVLIHTLYNIENLGNEIDEWESHTPNEQELKVEIITDMQDGKYTKTPYDYFIPRAEVPKGYYYCTIVHFADGSAKMGQVLYK